jgi:hypothetical protein
VLARAAWDASSRKLSQPRRFELATAVLDGLVAECLDHLGPIEQAQALLWCKTVLDVAVVEDLAEPTASPMLTNHVRGDALLGARAGKEKGERGAQQA